jgi:hypothetical protein
MVCDGAMVASTLVSMMLNGVCCMYQMQEEDERRVAIRKDIRLEYERQRMMDMEYWNYRPHNHNNDSNSNHNHNNSSHKRAYHSDSSLEEKDDHHQRRKLLMLAKKRHSSSSNAADRIDDRHDITVTSCPPRMVRTPPESLEKQLAASGTRPPQRRVRSDPVLQSAATEHRRERLLKAVDVSGEGSSLMDDDDDDEEEDELKLFDVALH